MKKHVALRSRQYTILTLGVLVCLIGAFLMLEGSIFGERTTGIATVIGIVGIVASARKRMEKYRA